MTILFSCFLQSIRIKWLKKYFTYTSDHSCSSDEACGLPFFAIGIVGIAFSVNLLQEPNHVVCHRPHGLQAFCIQTCLAASISAKWVLPSFRGLPLINSTFILLPYSIAISLYVIHRAVDHREPSMHILLSSCL